MPFKIAQRTYLCLWPVLTDRSRSSTRFAFPFAPSPPWGEARCALTWSLPPDRTEPPIAPLLKPKTRGSSLILHCACPVSQQACPPPPKHILNSTTPTGSTSETLLHANTPSPGSCRCLLLLSPEFLPVSALAVPHEAVLQSNKWGPPWGAVNEVIHVTSLRNMRQWLGMTG